MKFIFFPLENYTRELDSRLLIIDSILKGKSHSHERIISILLPKNLLPLLLYRLKSKVSILHKTLQYKFRPFIQQVARNSGNYYFLEEEYFDRFSNNSVRFGSEDLATAAFASTNVDFQSLSERLKNPVYLSGNPRIDVLHDAKNIFQSDIQRLNSKYGNFALFNSNFSFRNSPSDHTFDSLDKEDIFKSDAERQDLINFLDKHSKRFDYVFDYLRMLSIQKVYDNIIYRPHPNESLERAKEIFSNTDIIVDSSDNVVPWILSANCIYHCGCTTAIESSIIGNKAVFLFPFSSDFSTHSFLLSHSYISLENQSQAIKIDSQEINLELPLDQNINNPRYSSKMIANILVRDMKSTSLFKLLMFVTLSITCNLFNIINLYSSEKERVRRNSQITLAAKRLNIKPLFASNLLGIGIFSK